MIGDGVHVLEALPSWFSKFKGKDQILAKLKSVLGLSGIDN